MTLSAEGEDEEVVYEDRPYQQAIIQTCIEKNSIVFLPTGSGKTFIAIQVLKHFSHEIEKKYSEGGKRSIFLVNTVYLAKQQCETMKNQLTFNVELLIGEKNVDFWRQSDWDKVLDDSEVLVSTADVINTALDHSYIDINKINLIIFDECHHGRKDHAYAKIMRKFDPKSKTRIVGLSGMLVGLDGKIKPTNVKPELESLEAMFMSTIVTVDKIKDLQQMISCSTNASEAYLKFQPTPREFSTTKVQHILTNLKGTLERINLSKYEVSMNPKTLRPMTAKKIKDLMLMIDEFEYQSSEMGSFGGLLSLMSSLIQLEITKRFSDTIGYRKVVEVVITSVERCIKILKDDLGIATFDRKTIISNSSDKIRKILGILIKQFNDKDKDYQAIVFVKRRTTAKILYHIIKAIKMEEPSFPINPDFVVGANDDLPESIENIVSTSFSNLAIEKFKRKETNCIFSTSVLEEGIDLQMCNFVVTYDDPNTYREYVQGRGRARSDQSNYVVVIEETKEVKFQNKVVNWKEVESTLNDYLLLKTYDRPAPNDADIENQRGELWDPFITPISKSRLSGNNSIVILENYASKLPKDLFTNTNLTWNRRDLDEGGVIAEVQLPLQCKVNHKISSDPQRHVKIAKKHAAFKACIALYEAGELDDNLVPVSGESKVAQCHDEYFTHWDKYAGDGKKAGTTKNLRFHDITKPKVMENSNPIAEKSIYLHQIHVQPKFHSTVDADMIFHELLGNDRNFGILTSKRLPALCKLRLFQTYGEIQVEISTPPKLIVIPSEEKLEKLRQFHVTIFQDMLKIWKNFMAFDSTSFIFVPLMDGNVNWELVDSAQRVPPPKQMQYDEIKRTDFSRDAYDRMVVCPIYRSSDQTYGVINFTEHLTARSNFPNDEYDDYQDYYKQRYGTTIVCPDNNLIQVKGINKNYNLFFPGGGVSGKKKSYEKNFNTEYLVPELCHNYKIPVDYWLKAALLPSIFHRIQQLLLAEELRQRLKDEGIGARSYAEQINELDVDYGDFDKREKLLELFVDKDITVDDELKKKLIKIFKESQGTCSSGMLNDVVKSKALLWFDRSKLPIDLDRNWLTLKEVDIDYYYKFLNENRDFCSTIQSGMKRKYYVISPIKDQKSIADSIDRSKIKILNIDESSQTIHRKDLIKVLTTSKSGDVFDMERLEVLGDAFLKFSVSLYLFKKHEDWHEGYLTTLKGRIVSNRNLYYIGNDFGLSGMIKTIQFDAKNAVLPASKLPDQYNETLKNQKSLLENLYDVQEPTRADIFSGNIQISMKGAKSNTKADSADEKTNCGLLGFINQHRVGDKIIADAVEALIGCVVNSLGIRSGFELLKKMKILPSDHFIDNLLIERIEPRNIYEDNPSITNQKLLEATIGYTFRNPIYLAQALTHPSCPVKTFGTYQQLEFVGDAVLDFLVTSFIIENCPAMDPGNLTDLRSALVNNATLACIIVRNDIHKFLRAENLKLTEVINKFVEYQKSKNHVVQLDQIALMDTEEDQCLAESVDIPKIIGDLFESIIGAVFLDCDLDLEITWSVIYKLIKKELHEFMVDVPKQIVRQLYEYDKGAASPRFTAPFEFEEYDEIAVGVEVFIKGERKTFVGIGVNKKVAKKCAAKLALKALQQ